MTGIHRTYGLMCSSNRGKTTNTKMALNLANSWNKIYGPVVGSCEHDNEPLDSIKGDEFLHYLSEYYLLKDSVPWSQLCQ